jgi:hypothetical protein
VHLWRLIAADHVAEPSRCIGWKWWCEVDHGNGSRCGPERSGGGETHTGKNSSARGLRRLCGWEQRAAAAAPAAGVPGGGRRRQRRQVVGSGGGDRVGWWEAAAEAMPGGGQWQRRRRRGWAVAVAAAACCAWGTLAQGDSSPWQIFFWGWALDRWEERRDEFFFIGMGPCGRDWDWLVPSPQLLATKLKACSNNRSPANPRRLYFFPRPIFDFSDLKEKNTSPTQCRLRRRRDRSLPSFVTTRPTYLSS